MPRPTMHITQHPDIRHRFLWLKTVTAVNLSVHCFYSLVGTALPIRKEAREQRVTLPGAPAYYLCGVTAPYRWELNSHLLVVPDATAGARSVTTPGLSVTMEGLRVVVIDDSELDFDRYGGRTAFTTCRNLQGAAILAARHGFPNEEDRAAGLRQRQRASAGLAD